MRTGTSTCTSRNGRIRMRRMYSSRLIRLAARSNWLSTIDFPVIVRGDRAVAVTGKWSFVLTAPGRERAWLKPRLGTAAQAASCTPVYGQRRAASSLADEATMGQTARRVLRFGQRVRDVQPLWPAAARRGVREHADHVRSRGGGLGEGDRRSHVLQHEHQARGTLGNRGGERGPPGVGRLGALSDNQRASRRVEA